MRHACIMLQVLYVLDLTFHLQLIISVIIIRFSGFHFIFRLNLTEQRGAKTFHSAFKILIIVKLREREGQGVDPGRSLKGHLWMVDGGWWISFPWCFTLKGLYNFGLFTSRHLQCPQINKPAKLIKRNKLQSVWVRFARWI